MSMLNRYFEQIHQLLDRVADSQNQAIDKATVAVAETLKQGGTIYAFGTGHSHMLAEELFYRAGGLVKVHPIFEEPLMLHIGASESSQLERKEGYAAQVLAKAPISDKDVVFIFSNSGRNAVPVESAIVAKETGATVICITNLAHSGSSSSRHPSGKRLFEICDIVIDNCGVIGDSVMELGKYMCGPTSTVIGAAILQSIACGAVEKLQQWGVEPEVFCSANVDGGDAINHVLIEKYKQEIPML